MIARQGVVKLTIIVKQKWRNSSDIQRIYEDPVRSGVHHIEIDFAPILFLGEGLNLSRQYLTGGSPVSPYFNDNGKVAAQNIRLEIGLIQLFHPDYPLSPPRWL